MKILIIHSELFPGGGDTNYSLRLGKLLISKGHEVGYFTVKNERNINHWLSGFEAESIDYISANRNKNLSNSIKVIKTSIYNQNARVSLSKLLNYFKPDVAHLQSIHYHLSSSIIFELNKNKIPIVWTQHNLAMICCNYMLVRNQICEKCKPNKFYYPVLQRCKKDSIWPSLIGAMQLYFDYLSGIRNKVDKIIAISGFYMKKFQEFGFDINRLELLPNFFEIPEKIKNKNNKKEKDYILYFGRISPEKGVNTIIEAVGRINDNIILKVIGDGSERKTLELRAKELNLNNIIFLGFKSGHELLELINNSLFSIVPSLWYENFPFSILESFSCKKAVIGANIGGISELVVNNITGLLFESGNAFDLAKKIKLLYHDPVKQKTFGEEGYRFLVKHLNKDTHYNKLLDIYQSVIK